MSLVKVEFKKKQRITQMKCKSDQLMKEICLKYSQKEQLNYKRLFFYYNNVRINEELTFENQAIRNDRNLGKITILVEEIKPNQENSAYIKSKEIICPKCGEESILNIKDFKFQFVECKNGHKIENILINDYEEKQKIDQTRIKCGFCYNSKLNSKNGEFYLCFTCNQKLCPLCKLEHDNNHYIINYDNKNCLCPEHKNENFNFYCKNCKKNLCYRCKKSHIKHEIEELNIIEKESLNQKNVEINNIINKYAEDLNNIIQKFKNTIEKLKLYNKIKQDYFNNYEENNRNYIILKNLKEIYYNNTIIQDIIKIINDDNIYTKISKIIHLYNDQYIDEENDINNLLNILNNKKSQILNNKKINKKIKLENNDFITLRYKIDTNEINIFSLDFVNNNRNNSLYIVFNEEKIEFNEKINISKYKIDEDFIEIKLCGFNNIRDASYMFYDCKSLISLQDFWKWNTINVDNMSHMFYNCHSLISLPDISNWNTINVTNMSYMFYRCSLLKILPDISHWKTNNITHLSNMFNGCSSLEYLPDISNWYTKNVKYMDYLFNDCSSLKSLPDISKWQTDNVINMSYLFNNCSSLEILPDISKWNTKKVKYMNDLFNNCFSLKSLPDISSWNTSSVIDISRTFCRCKSLKNVPNITKWEIKSVRNINNLFDGCSSVESLPNISSIWDFQKVKTMDDLFIGCTNLKNYDKLKKWNEKTVGDKKYGKK